MKFDYISVGIGLVGIGFALMVALPPPWWPKMPTPAVQFGIALGLVMVFLGIAIGGIGAWPGLPNPKGPWALILMGIVSLLSGACWFYLAKNSVPLAPLTSGTVSQPATSSKTSPTPFLTLGNDLSVGGGSIFGRLGGPTADLTATIYTQDTTSIGSGRGVTLTVNLINNDSRPVYLSNAILLEVYFFQKGAVWNTQEFKDMFSVAIKSGAGFRYQERPEMAQAYKIGETNLYFAKYPASKLTYNGNLANGLITVAGNTVSQLAATFDTPKLNRDQFNGIIEAIELDILNDQGFAVMRLCPISVTNHPALPTEGGYQGWNPLWKQPYQIVPNSDETVVCQPAADDSTNLPASPPASLKPQQPRSKT